MIKNLEDIYLKYYKELYLYAFSLCRNHDLAQDLVSDTFLKAMLSLENNHLSLKFWLFRVCKNLYIDNLRKSKNSQSMGIYEELIGNKSTPLDSIILSESKKQLYTTVLSLKEEYKEVILLFYYFNFSIKEISYTLNAPEGTIKSWLFRAKNQLKVILKEEFY